MSLNRQVVVNGVWIVTIVVSVGVFVATVYSEGCLGWARGVKMHGDHSVGLGKIALLYSVFLGVGSVVSKFQLLRWSLVVWTTALMCGLAMIMYESWRLCVDWQFFSLMGGRMDSVEGWQIRRSLFRVIGDVLLLALYVCNGYLQLRCSRGKR